jgi:hypothetical protein
MLSIQLDTSGFDCFIEIVEKLEQGEEISRKEWSNLFSTPGYNSLVEKEFNKDFFIKAFTLAYNPTLKEVLEKQLETSIGRFLKHYLKINEIKEEYVRNIKNIKENWEKLSGTIFSRATSFIPDKEYETEATISIVIFDTDARGYDNIIIDACFTDSLESFVSITSHELFHHYRNQFLVYNKDEIDEEDKDIVHILNQIHTEGIADHIDKEYFIYGNVKTCFPEDYINRFKKYVLDAPNILRRVDNKICELSSEKADRKKINEELKKLVSFSGHPLGYYMTRLIIKNALVDKLIRNIGNPFSFFRLYNEATNRDKVEKQSLSVECLKIINDLETKYLKKSEKK